MMAQRGSRPVPRDPRALWHETDQSFGSPHQSLTTALSELMKLVTGEVAAVAVVVAALPRPSSAARAAPVLAPATRLPSGDVIVLLPLSKLARLSATRLYVLAMAAESMGEFPKRALITAMSWVLFSSWLPAVGLQLGGRVENQQRG